MMGYYRTRIAIGVGGFITAAFLVLLAARSSLRLEGADVPAASVETTKSMADLVADASRAIVRLDIWGLHPIKNATTGKMILDNTGTVGTGFVVRCTRLGGDDTTDDLEFDVVSNNHVLATAAQKDWVTPAKLQCTAYGLNVTSATILGTDVTADLGVVRIRAKAPKDIAPRVLAWADPNSARVGDEVLAIGYARDLQGRPTVTRGIVSAMRRTEAAANGSDGAAFADLIQTDASVNHGNSGGPLLNMRGEVLGVVTYGLGATVTKDAKGNVSVEETLGIGYARSSRTARPFVEQIISNGNVSRLDLGCKLVSLPELFVRFLGWPPSVLAGTPTAATALATTAGLRAGDLIIAVGSAAVRPDTPDPSQETKVSSVGELNDALGLRGGDASIWVRFIRPPPALLLAFAATANGQQPPTYTSGGNVYWAFLR